MAKDPVYDMEVDPEDAPAKAEYGGRRIISVRPAARIGSKRI